MTHTQFDNYYFANEQIFKEAVLINIFGQTGSGKTRAAKKLVNTLVDRSRSADLTIIDGKGGKEWSAYKNVVDAHGNLQGVRDIFKDLAEDVRYQLQSGVKENKLVLVDEADTLFNKIGMSRADFKLSEEINKHLSYIATRARTTGVRVILLSQRASSESVPRHLRDNAYLRIAFKLSSDIEEEVALGNQDRGVSPCDIQYKEVGLAVVQDSNGTRELVQF